MFLHYWFRDVCRVCITGSESVMKRRDGLCFASTGQYTRFTFCSTYTQAYSKLCLPLHYDAFLPAKQSDLPVDSTTRLHAHRGTCSSAYQFFFFSPFGLKCTLTCELICWSMYPHTDLPQHICTCSF